jgi:hypothetical protein
MALSTTSVNDASRHIDVQTERSDKPPAIVHYQSSAGFDSRFG